jgi:hypothetical protein
MNAVWPGTVMSLPVLPSQLVWAKQCGQTTLPASNSQGHQRAQPEGHKRSLPTQRPQ